MKTKINNQNENRNNNAAHAPDALEWKACLLLCGDMLRPGAKIGDTDRKKVLARSYTDVMAAKRLNLPDKAIQNAILSKTIPSFVDPDHIQRIPAALVETAIGDDDAWEQIAGFTPLKVRLVSIVAGVSFTTLRNRLKKAGVNPADLQWKDVRGLWGLPVRLAEFNAIYQGRSIAWREGVLAKKEGSRPTVEKFSRKFQEKVILGREHLRQKLLEAFPTWESDLHPYQHITLHLGPTNSGKTYQALNELVTAGSGWYLSPLRLLAHEVFDTLNKRGVACSLLTGEESIPVDGAQITAATIEMFNPARSGECVVIDEAHMLSDSQRGWAWTKAIMETRSPNIHIIGAPFIEPLVKRLANGVNIKIETIEHERLTPLKVIKSPWSLADLPSRTILIAFSRSMVLGLKSELEKIHHRRVAVVYGSLPPEVRLNQAERFANGESEICVATDAVGLGLNLPADNVCFFETQKYDGHSRRTLTPNEIRQIGGRAGRFGLSDFGLVGALTRADLQIVQRAVDYQQSETHFAHVAPTPDALQMIPGTLAEKLAQWIQLVNIPIKWRRILMPVDLSEQIDLAKMLTPGDVNKLGEEPAFKLINAPTYRETELYWHQCARAIIKKTAMPAPAGPPSSIHDGKDLQSYEKAIRCADTYLWLSQRDEFSRFAPESDMVRSWRETWSMEVDAALQRKVDTTRRCHSCGKPLALKYRFNICENCFQSRNFDSPDMGY